MTTKWLHGGHALRDRRLMVPLSLVTEAPARAAILSGKHWRTYQLQILLTFPTYTEGRHEIPFSGLSGYHCVHDADALSSTNRRNRRPASHRYRGHGPRPRRWLFPALSASDRYSDCRNFRI